MHAMKCCKKKKIFLIFSMLFASLQMKSKCMQNDYNAAVCKKLRNTA